MTYKKGQELELTTEGLAYGGRGIARQNNFVFFVEAAIPGQKVLVYISRKRKDFAEARIKEIISQSPHFTNPKCEHFLHCGGCKSQHIDYLEQFLDSNRRIILNRVLKRKSSHDRVTIITSSYSPEFFKMSTSVFIKMDNGRITQVRSVSHKSKS